MCVSVQSFWKPLCLFCSGNSRSGGEEAFSLQITNQKVICFCPLSEIEAKEACDWLRAAGFPQYAQLYEGRHLNSVLLQQLLDNKMEYSPMNEIQGHH